VIPAGVTVIFVAAILVQLFVAFRLQRTYPDRWSSAEETHELAPDRDAGVKKRALERGDHLVASSAPPRAVAWVTALRMASDNLVIGQGPSSWVYRSVLYSNEPIVNTFHQHRQFAHNDLFQTAAEWGVAPAVAWVLAWAGAFWNCARRSADNLVSELPILLALLGMGLHALMHFPLQVPALQLWTALVLGLAWSRPPRLRLKPLPRT
jgi:O-antigen ligase